MPKITMYMTDWCPYCRMTRSLFDRYKVEYEMIDVDQDEDAAFQVEQWNGGNRTVPTLVIDGAVYTNPGTMELKRLLELN